MANFKHIATIFGLLSALTACLGQVSEIETNELQGGPHVSQGGPHVSQGSLDVSQGGPHTSQGEPHESQGYTRISQEGAHTSQGGAHESQGAPHQDQGRVRRQAEQDPRNQLAPDWISCEFKPTSKISCYDCNTRVICKKIGGILKPCSPKQPFCNNGICSAVPTAECA